MKNKKTNTSSNKITHAANLLTNIEKSYTQAKEALEQRSQQKNNHALIFLNQIYQNYAILQESAYKAKLTNLDIATLWFWLGKTENLCQIHNEFITQLHQLFTNYFCSHTESNNEPGPNLLINQQIFKNAQTLLNANSAEMYTILINNAIKNNQHEYSLFLYETAFCHFEINFKKILNEYNTSNNTQENSLSDKLKLTLDSPCYKQHILLLIDWIMIASTKKSLGDLLVKCHKIEQKLLHANNIIAPKLSSKNKKRTHILPNAHSPAANLLSQLYLAMGYIYVKNTEAHSAINTFTSHFLNHTLINNPEELITNFVDFLNSQNKYHSNSPFYLHIKSAMTNGLQRALWIFKGNHHSDLWLLAQKFRQANLNTQADITRDIAFKHITQFSDLALSSINKNLLIDDYLNWFQIKFSALSSTDSVDFSENYSNLEQIQIIWQPLQILLDNDDEFYIPFQLSNAVTEYLEQKSQQQPITILSNPTNPTNPAISEISDGFNNKQNQSILINAELNNNKPDVNYEVKLAKLIEILNEIELAVKLKFHSKTIPALNINSNNLNLNDILLHIERNSMTPILKKSKKYPDILNYASKALSLLKSKDPLFYKAKLILANIYLQLEQLESASTIYQTMFESPHKEYAVESRIKLAEIAYKRHQFRLATSLLKLIEPSPTQAALLSKITIAVKDEQDKLSKVEDVLKNKHAKLPTIKNTLFKAREWLNKSPKTADTYYDMLLKTGILEYYKILKTNYFYTTENDIPEIDFTDLKQLACEFEAVKTHTPGNAAPYITLGLTYRLFARILKTNLQSVPKPQNIAEQQDFYANHQTYFNIMEDALEQLQNAVRISEPKSQPNDANLTESVHPDLIWEMALLQYETQKYFEAATNLKMLSQYTFSKTPHARVKLAEIQLEQNHNEDALITISELVKDSQDSSSAFYLANYPKNDVCSLTKLYLLATTAAQKNQLFTEAREYISQAQKINQTQYCHDLGPFKIILLTTEHNSIAYESMLNTLSCTTEENRKLPILVRTKDNYKFYNNINGELQNTPVLLDLEDINECLSIQGIITVKNRFILLSQYYPELCYKIREALGFNQTIPAWDQIVTTRINDMIHCLELNSQQKTQDTSHNPNTNPGNNPLGFYANKNNIIEQKTYELSPNL